MTSVTWNKKFGTYVAQMGSVESESDRRPKTPKHENAKTAEHENEDLKHANEDPKTPNVR